MSDVKNGVEYPVYLSSGEFSRYVNLETANKMVVDGTAVWSGDFLIDFEGD